MRTFCFHALLMLSTFTVNAETWPVQFSWDFTQPVPPNVEFELRVQPNEACDFKPASTTRNLVVTSQCDYDTLKQGSVVVVRDSRTGAEIEQIKAYQIRLDTRLMPALRECRMGGKCPGPSAMRDVLRENGERAVSRDRVEPRAITP